MASIAEPRLIAAFKEQKASPGAGRIGATPGRFGPIGAARPLPTLKRWSNPWAPWSPGRRGGDARIVLGSGHLPSIFPDRSDGEQRRLFRPGTGGEPCGFETGAA
jgi:hypothetical protein